MSKRQMYMATMFLVLCVYGALNNLFQYIDGRNEIDLLGVAVYIVAVIWVVKYVEE